MARKKPTIAVIGLYGASVFMGMNRFPRDGETVFGHDYLLEPGGKGFNQAVAAARLGASVGFITATGTDDFGKSCVTYLQKEGIDDHFIKKCELPTAAATILYDSVGTSRVVVFPGASTGLTAGDVAACRKIIGQSEFLLVQNEMPIETLHAAVDLAHELGVRVIFNPAPAGDFKRELLEKTYVVTPNEGEALSITRMESNDLTQGPPPKVMAEGLHRLGAKRVVITLGEQGAYVSDDGDGTMIPAMTVDAVDTTGAGDTFNAALAVALARGQSLTRAARYAVVASALAVTKRGVMAALPHKESVEQLIED